MSQLWLYIAATAWIITNTHPREINMEIIPLRDTKALEKSTKDYEQCFSLVRGIICQKLQSNQPPAFFGI